MHRRLWTLPVLFALSAWGGLRCTFQLLRTAVGRPSVPARRGADAPENHMREKRCYHGGAASERRRRLHGIRGALVAARAEGTPNTLGELLAAKRSGAWSALTDSLDWTRYHLQVAVVEHGGSGRSRVAAGLFERIARYHSCAGALPAEALTTGGVVLPVPPSVSDKLNLNSHWIEREVYPMEASYLGHYDVVACVDARAKCEIAAMLRAQGRAGSQPLPPHVVELGDFGAYLEMRRVESPMKAWVPDWRAQIDPDYDRRQAEAQAPRDDALGVWHSMPEDLACLVQPRYARVAASLTADDAARATNSPGYCEYGGDDDAAVLAFHVAGLVRFLMDSYPLDLHGGPGYVPP